MPHITKMICNSPNELNREAFNPLQMDREKPAHIFLRSVHNIVIERGWLDLRNTFGHNFTHFLEAGNGIYNDQNPTHRSVFNIGFDEHVELIMLQATCQLAMATINSEGAQ